MTRVSYLRFIKLLVLAALCAFPVPAPSRPTARSHQQTETPSPAQSQTPKPSDLLKQAWELIDREQLDAARAVFLGALEQAAAEKDAVAEAEARRGLGSIHYRKAEYPAARLELEKARELYETLGDRLNLGRVFNSLANVSWGMGDEEQAREFYKKALAEFEVAGDLRAKANTLINLTLLRNVSAEERSAALEEALLIARRIANKNLEGRVLHNQGDFLFVGGDFSAAMEKLDQAAALFEELNQREGLAGVWISMGRVQRAHGYPEDAIVHYQRALRIQEEINDKQGIIQSMNAIGAAFTLLGKYREAAEQFKRALALAQETGSPRLVDFLRGALAGAYNDLGEYARAAELLEEVIRRGADTQLAYRYYGLSRAYLGLGRAREALAASESSVELARKENLDLLADALADRVRARTALGQTEAALADLREATAVVEQIRAKIVPTDFMKRGFAERHQNLFTLSIEMHFRAGEYKRAFEIAEQARARAFLDLLASRSAKVETAALWKTWHGADPALLSSETAQPFTVAQMAATAARLRSTVLSYWVAAESLFVWVVRPDGKVHAAQVDVRAQHLEGLVRKTSLAVAFPASDMPMKAGVAPLPRGIQSVALPEGDREAWHELYRWLIRPIERFLPTAPGSRLTVIPHGALFRVSFAALRDDANRYFVERYTLHFAPAGAVLEFTGRRRKAAAHNPRYLLVADPVPPLGLKGEKRLPALPAARAEVKAIGAMLPPNRVTLLFGAQATESEVRARAGESSVIHFATHAIVLDDRPLDSFLLLAADTSGGSDGRLVLAEIYGLKVAGNLVVLSACRSGQGKVTGDGLIGLARAFFYAGAPSLVVTQWEVADHPSRLLMTAFYRHLLQRKDNSRALRAAQLELLHLLRAGKVNIHTPAGLVTLPEHPTFWAGYVLLGEP